MLSERNEADDEEAIRRRNRSCVSGVGVAQPRSESELSRKSVVPLQRQARTNFITLSDPEIEALNAYDNLYYDLESEDESTEDQQDFCKPLQSSDRSPRVKSEDESS